MFIIHLLKMAPSDSPIKDRHLREFRKAFADGRVGTGPEDPRRSKFFELQKVSPEEGHRICSVVAEEVIMDPYLIWYEKLIMY